MKTKIALVLMTLAVACLSLSPALAAPSDRNDKDRCNDSFEMHGFAGHNDWMLLVDDATKDNFENMTLKEIRELRDEKTGELNNMTSAQIDELHKNQMDKLNNMTLGEIKKMGMGHIGIMGKGIFGQDMIGQDMMPRGPMGQENDDALANNGRGPGGRQ